MLVLFCIHMWQWEQYRDLKRKGPDSTLSPAQAAGDAPPRTPSLSEKDPGQTRACRGWGPTWVICRTGVPWRPVLGHRWFWPEWSQERLSRWSLCQWSGWSLVRCCLNCCYFHVSSLLSEYSIFPYGRCSPLWYSGTRIVFADNLVIPATWPYLRNENEDFNFRHTCTCKGFLCTAVYGQYTAQYLLQDM